MKTAGKAEELSTQPTLTAALNKVTNVAAQLNDESDSLNSILSKVQEQLNASNIGLEVWLDSALASKQGERSRGENTWTSQFLGYAKLDDEWCLAVKTVGFATGFFENDTSCPYEERNAVGEPVRLAWTSRQVRIAALSQLPELLERLAAEAKRCIKTINEAKMLAQ